MALCRCTHSAFQLRRCDVEFVSHTAFFVVGRFDDVFIFNFFADSPADEKSWRVITAWWKERRRPNMTPAERSELVIPAPRPVPFSKEKHGILEEELKQLCAPPLELNAQRVLPASTRCYSLCVRRTIVITTARKMIAYW